MAKSDLNQKQQRFVDEYIVDLNGRQAAIRAGYSAKTAESQASRLLTNAKVQALIQARMAERSKRTEVTQDQVIQELELIALSDLRAFASWGMDPLLSDEQIQCLEEANLQVPESKRVQELDSEAVNYLKENGNPIKWRTIDLKNSDKLGLESRVVQSVSENQHGVSIKLHDKLKALELLGRHLGMKFAQKHEHTGKDGGPIETKAAGLSDATAEALRKKILGVGE